MSGEPHRIDVHHHIVPRDYVEALAEIGVETPGGFPFPDCSLEASLEVMDQNGIATVSGLAEHCGLDAGARIAIERDNAARLFPRRVAPGVSRG